MADKNRWQLGAAALMVSSLLAACSGEKAKAPPAQSVQTGGPSLANSAPQISGMPSTTARVGERYEFTPAGFDADGDTLTWSVQGLPQGASFNTATGALSWTPAATGTHDVVITVSDGRGATASMSISIVAASRRVVLRWEAPAQFTDGTALPTSELGGYRIYHGSSESGLQRIAEVDRATLAMALEDLQQGTHYFAVTAVTASGLESDFSTVVGKNLM